MSSDKGLLSQKGHSRQATIHFATGNGANSSYINSVNC